MDLAARITAMAESTMARGSALRPGYLGEEVGVRAPFNFSALFPQGVLCHGGQAAVQRTGGSDGLRGIRRTASCASPIPTPKGLRWRSGGRASTADLGSWLTGTWGLKPGPAMSCCLSTKRQVLRMAASAVVPDSRRGQGGGVRSVLSPERRGDADVRGRELCRGGLGGGRLVR